MRFSAFFGEWTREYYANAAIGKVGDFYTSVSASRFFGGALARYILQRLERGDVDLPLDIIDVGANSFDLLHDIYCFLDALSVGVVDKCSFIGIDSASLHFSRRDLGRNAANFHACKNLESLGTLQNNAIFVANEFFDALPCELYTALHYDSPAMACVENDNLIFSAPYAELQNLALQENILCGEIPTSYFDFTRTLKCINPHDKKWIFLVFDYGEIFYENRFSVRMYSKHQVQPLFDKKLRSVPLVEYFGKCDITYNVPFLLLNAAFDSIGARAVAFKRQYLALIEDFGILDLLQDFYDAQEDSSALYVRESNKIKTLLNLLNGSFKNSIYEYF